MGLFEKFEHQIENAMDGVFSKLGKKNLKPVDILIALRNEMNNSAVEVKNAKQVVSNVYEVTLSEVDYNRLESWGAAEFVDELVVSLEENKISEGYSVLGEIVVSFVEDLNKKVGEYEITSDAKRDEFIQNSSNIQNEPNESIFNTVSANSNQNDETVSNSFDDNSYKYNSVEIDGVKTYLTEPITSFGRGSTSDIIIDDSSISRKHFEIKITENNVIASDLQSTNGIYIDGSKTKAGTLHDGSVITIGKKIIVFRAKKIKPQEESSSIFVNKNVDVIADNSENEQTDAYLKPKSFFMTQDIRPNNLEENNLTLNNQSPDDQNPDNIKFANLGSETSHSNSELDNSKSQNSQLSVAPDPFDELQLSEPIVNSNKDHHQNEN